jgi:adenosylmethionine-8-amino-7-oxononanoate aminotransferase
MQAPTADARPIPAGACPAADSDSHLWHPFAQMAEFAAFPPLHIVAGQGGWLTDSAGREYLDGNASIWTNVHGHNDPELNAAVRNQLERVAHTTLLGLTHGPAEELAAALIQLAPPGLERVFYSDNGAGAVEVALKQSFQFWQLQGRPEKREVIGLAGGYHGDTFGAMAVGDSGFFHARFSPWFFPAHHFPAPACSEWAGTIRSANAADSLAALETLLNERGATTACLILEPSVQGAAGMRLQPPGFVEAVARLCRRYSVHLILDEVFVAFGRLGAMTVSGELGVVPDFLCLAKGLTAGYLPLAATLTRPEIFAEFLGTYSSGKAFFHGHTFTGNPLACAVALANIRKLEALMEGGALARRSAAFGHAIEAHFGRHCRVGEIRQRGLAAAVDLVPHRGSERRFLPDDRIGMRVCLRARDHGLLLRPLGDTLLLVPPLCLDEPALAELARRTAAAIDDLLPE